MTKIETTRKSDFARGVAGIEAVFCHPEEVLADRTLDVEAKRALLASWASDAHAVEHAPTLRQLESGAIVKIDAIMDALRALDTDEVSSARPIQFFRRRRKRGIMPPRVKKESSGPDDDPPPAAAARPPILAAA